jgi:hypothetical protein
MMGCRRFVPLDQLRARGLVSRSVTAEHPLRSTVEPHMTDLTDLGVAAIRDGVASGDFTAVEVAEAFNANVAAAQAALNAFIVATPEKALEAARADRCRRAAGQPLGSWAACRSA